VVEKDKEMKIDIISGCCFFMVIDDESGCGVCCHHN
jgi:hypothetical protein